jgi:phosphopantetheine adenylyltransferase
VREVAELGGDISEFVSPTVKKALLERIGKRRQK